MDDELNILNSLKRLLRQEYYAFLTANSGTKQSVQVVMTDCCIPDISGTEFLKAVKTKYPDTIRIVLSGYAEVNSIMDDTNQGQKYRFICIPWNYDEIKLTIRQCLDQFELCLENNKLSKTLKILQLVLKNIIKGDSKLVIFVSYKSKLVTFSEKLLNIFPDLIKMKDSEIKKCDPDNLFKSISNLLEEVNDNLIHPFENSSNDYNIQVSPLRKEELCRVML